MQGSRRHFSTGGAKKIFEKCRPPWLGDEENFAYYSSLKGSKQLLSNLITLLHNVSFIILFLLSNKKKLFSKKVGGAMAPRPPRRRDPCYVGQLVFSLIRQTSCSIAQKFQKNHFLDNCSIVIYFETTFILSLGSVVKHVICMYLS